MKKENRKLREKVVFSFFIIPKISTPQFLHYALLMIFFSLYSRIQILLYTISVIVTLQVQNSCDEG